MNDVLEFIEKPYSLQTTSHFRSRKIRKANYSLESPYLGPKLWNLVQDEYRTIESPADFKENKIKNWISENCPCRLCKTNIYQIGFI